MRKFKTLDNFEEDYFRQHPEEIKSYLTEIFEEYAKDGNHIALLSSLKIIAKIQGVTNMNSETNSNQNNVSMSVLKNFAEFMVKYVNI